MREHMTGKERIEAVFRGRNADSIPWVPFAGVHAGKLAGYSAREVSTDADKLVESLRKVHSLYRPDGMPVMFDLQIEAELLGCDLVWSEDAPPTVSSHPLAQTQTIPSRLPGPDEGRLALELEVMARVKREFGEQTALYGLFCGPFTLASHLRGTNIFMDMVLDPDYVHSLLDYTLQVSQFMARCFSEAGMDVLAVVDPLISQISPEHFREFMHTPFSELFGYIKELGAFSSFFVCGNATMNIEPMCQTGPDSISVDENVDLAQAKRITDSYGVVIGGNIPLTTVMLFGSQQDNMKAAVQIIDSVPPGRLVISPGCDMPYDTPVEHVLAIEQAVHQTHSVREMVNTYEGSTFAFTGTLPDYEHLQRPLVEVFTLDSATCAACAYMVEVAKEAQHHMDIDVDVVEYKYTSTENIARCREMGITKLPSIYINGELAYSSIIPSRDKLIEEITEKAAAT